MFIYVFIRKHGLTGDSVLSNIISIHLFNTTRLYSFLHCRFWDIKVALIYSLQGINFFTIHKPVTRLIYLLLSVFIRNHDINMLHFMYVYFTLRKLQKCGLCQIGICIYNILSTSCLSFIIQQLLIGHRVPCEV